MLLERATAPPLPTVLDVQTQTSWAHALRERLQSVSEAPSFQRCGRPWKGQVEIVRARSGETRAYGVHSCGMIGLCPVCWSRRRIMERAELVMAGEQWFASGGALEVATLTVPHHAAEPLVAVRDRLETYAAPLRTGKSGVAMRAAYGIEGIWRATETTYGPNGWHPHQHLLLWLQTEWTREIRAAFWRRWWEKIRRKRPEPARPEERPPGDSQNLPPEDLEREAGHLTKGPSRSTEERYERALAEGNDDLAQYLAPFVFGGLASAGDRQALAVWREYETATARLQIFRWPNGWRDRFGLDRAGAYSPFEGETVTSFPAREWSR